MEWVVFQGILFLFSLFSLILLCISTTNQMFPLDSCDSSFVPFLRPTSEEFKVPDGMVGFSKWILGDVAMSLIIYSVTLH